MVHTTQRCRCGGIGLPPSPWFRRGSRAACEGSSPTYARLARGGREPDRRSHRGGGGKDKDVQRGVKVCPHRYRLQLGPASTKWLIVHINPSLT